MKFLSIILLILILTISGSIYFAHWVFTPLPETPVKLFDCEFYDGEGNPIPIEAVRILVNCQFVIPTAAQTDTMNKYFYCSE